MLENNNNDESKDSQEEEKNKTPNVWTLLNNCQKLLVDFVLIITSPDKKLTLFGDMTTKCVENCKVELI